MNPPTMGRSEETPSAETDLTHDPAYRTWFLWAMDEFDGETDAWPLAAEAGLAAERQGKPRVQAEGAAHRAVRVAAAGRRADTQPVAAAQAQRPMPTVEQQRQPHQWHTSTEMNVTAATAFKVGAVGALGALVTTTVFSLIYAYLIGPAIATLIHR